MYLLFTGVYSLPSIILEPQFGDGTQEGSYNLEIQTRPTFLVRRSLSE